MYTEYRTLSVVERIIQLWHAAVVCTSGSTPHMAICHGATATDCITPPSHPGPCGITAADAADGADAKDDNALVFQLRGMHGMLVGGTS